MIMAALKNRTFVCLLWLWILIVWKAAQTFHVMKGPGLPVIAYSRHELLQLRFSASSLLDPDVDLPEIKPRAKVRKRGSRGGVRVRNRRRGHKPVLPSVTMGNVRSLVNKADELTACLKFDRTFRQTSLLCLSETWLSDRIPDSHVEMEGFALHRMDRDQASTGKKQGGGVCLYVNNRWCHTQHVTVKERVCDPNIELIAVSCRPYYLPREFSHVIVMVVYIPPSGNGKCAIETISRITHDLQRSSPDALVILNGDFNHCTLSTTLPSFKQMVTCPTRGDNVIDLFYTNVKDGYVAKLLPPLGKSDHNLINLTSKYSTVIRKQPIMLKTVRVWSDDACETLKGCFECTDWSVFFDGDSDLDSISDKVTCYINYCVEAVIPCKQIKIFPNNKPWVTREVKAAINKKKAAFYSGDKERIKDAQRELKVIIRQGKQKYKESVEGKMTISNTRGLWNGMKCITGYGTSNPSLCKLGIQANDANTFFGRFDECDFSSVHENVLSNLRQSSSEDCSSAINLSIEEVRKQLRRIKPNKAEGPDGVHPRTLKVCADQLCSVLHSLFSLSLSSAKISVMWKTSCLIPIPKKAKVTNSLANLRPIALASHIMKCFERVVLDLTRQVSAFQDPLQFAYRKDVGVDDALLFMLHNIYSHLETTASSVRIMFFDFSSAFNTIQPHILANKLSNFKLHNTTIAWILDYLLLRPQFVRFGNKQSEIILTNTGAPRGTVLSPFLFTLRTIGIVSHPVWYKNSLTIPP